MEYFSMIFIFVVGLIIHSALVLYINQRLVKHIRKTDDSIFQIYTEILQLRAYMRMKDKFENDKIWMDDLDK